MALKLCTIFCFPDTDLKNGSKNKCVHTPADTGLPGKQNTYFLFSLNRNVTKVVGILQNNLSVVIIIFFFLYILYSNNRF